MSVEGERKREREEDEEREETEVSEKKGKEEKLEVVVVVEGERKTASPSLSPLLGSRFGRGFARHQGLLFFAFLSLGIQKRDIFLVSTARRIERRNERREQRSSAIGASERSRQKPEAHEDLPSPAASSPLTCRLHLRALSHCPSAFDSKSTTADDNKCLSLFVSGQWIEAGRHPVLASRGGAIEGVGKKKSKKACRRA